jgi:hypothetical protein
VDSVARVRAESMIQELGISRAMQPVTRLEDP